MKWLRSGLILVLIASPAWAQQRGAKGPHVAYVYPAGGQQGSTFTVEIAGQSLNNITNAFVSGGGVRAVVLEALRPPNGKEATELRDELKDLERLRNGKPLPTNSVFRTMSREQIRDRIEAIRKQLAAFEKRRTNPAMADSAILQITIAPDAAPGERELRLGTGNGLSNPLVFHVGQLPEFKKAEKKPDRPPRARLPQREGTEPTETVITLPATVNGQILPGGVDRYRFTARKGQRLVAIVSARSLIPYLADAVPGWFQAVLALYDAHGNELAYVDDYKFHPDPVLYYEIPADGEYTLEIHDAIYRGRDDFVYRITIGEIPFITSIFPLGGRVGTKITVAVRGWNLPQTTTVLDATGQAPGVYPFTPSRGAPAANCLRFALDTLPELLEKEPNNQPGRRAQRVTVPVIINGRIDQPGDIDVFEFEGRAGQELVAEVVARRLHSPLDSLLKVTDARGCPLAVNDDSDDKGAGLETHHADSYLRLTLPTNGVYYAILADTQHKGGPDYAYRLRLSAPRPDFELRAVPSSLTVRGGGTVPLTVYALRRDGCTNAISLALTNAPAGFKLTGATVITTQDQVQVTLSAPPAPTAEPLPIQLVGRATIDGAAVVHPATPAEDEMQAFAYRHLVPAKELDLVVMGRPAPRTAIRLLNPTPLKIPAGGTCRLRFAHELRNVHFQLTGAPPGLVLHASQPTSAGTELILANLAMKPGQTGTLSFQAFVRGKNGKQQFKLEPLPGIPFEIVTAGKPN